MALVVAGWGLVACGENAAEPDTPPCRDCNLVLIAIDTLRADHLPCYGYDRETAPRICGAAQRGFLFENAISQSNWTKTAMASVFTALYPHNHGATGDRTVLPEELVTLTETLREKGYYTGAYQTNPHLNEQRNFDQGFDEYHYVYKLPAEDLAREFMEHVRARGQAADRYFFYLHFMDTHLPYGSSQRLIDRFDRGYAGNLSRKELQRRSQISELELKEADKHHIVDLYDAAIAYVDENIGLVLDFLKEAGLWERSLVILLSDHGEEFWDHGGFEHGHTMYNELLRVPLVLMHPGLDGQGRRISEVVRLVDVYPTLLAMLGLEAPEGLMGRNLAGELLGGRAVPELVAFSEFQLYGGNRNALQTRSHKLIADPDGTRFEFFDLRADPGERVNLVDRGDKTVLTALDERMKTFRSAGPVTPAAGLDVELDEKTRDELRALGYLEEPQR